MAPTRGDRVHAGLMRAAAVLTGAYWAEFFTSGRVRTSEDRAYVDFERAFLLADAYMAIAYLAAARRLSQGHPDAVGIGVAAGSAMTFLGLMDLAYDLQQGKFADRTPEMMLEAAIVASSLILGPLTMMRLWRARRRLGA